MTNVLFRLEQASIIRSGGEPLFRDLTWTMRDGETWAVVGPNGSGKSTLAEMLAGKHRLAAGSLTWPLFATSGDEAHSVVRLVPFRENSRLFSPADYYYQQRFDFGDPPDCPTVSEYLRATRPVTDADLETTTTRLGIATLLDQKLLTLSTGQMRRTRLARAVLTHPKLLILDDPFCGLDVAGRLELDRTLADLAASGTRLILVLGEAVPSWVTNILVLPRNVPEALATEYSIPKNPSLTLPARADSAIEMCNVTLRHGGKLILDGVNWSVGVGERWALIGPNGSGKTTLLSLICGDHPAAYANHVRLFGKQRGDGETIWDVKRQIGLLSPELHQYFTTPLSAFEVATTGWHDVMTRRPITAEQADEVRRLFATFGLQNKMNTPFARLSTGIQRLVLFVRAVVKRPPLLILDEPFQALDTFTINCLREWIDNSLQPEQTLIMVTHRPTELPTCVTRRLQLANGRVVLSC